MSITEIKKEARDALKGNWGKAVCIILAYMLFTFALGFVEGFFEGNTVLFFLIEIAVLVISMPLSFGLLISFMKLKRGEDVKSFGFLKDGFSRFGKSWGIWWHTFVRLLLPMVCLILIAILMTFLTIFANSLNTATVATSTGSILSILSTVIYIATLIYVVSRAFLYILAYNIGYDNSELSSKDCVLKSETLMKGNRGTYFLLELSFIGWAILAVFTLGIGLLWLAPYMQVAAICFNDRFAKPEVKTVEEEVKIEQ